MIYKIIIAVQLLPHSKYIEFLNFRCIALTSYSIRNEACVSVSNCRLPSPLLLGLNIQYLYHNNILIIQRCTYNVGAFSVFLCRYVNNYHCLNLHFLVFFSPSRLL